MAGINLKDLRIRDSENNWISLENWNIKDVIGSTYNVSLGDYLADNSQSVTFDSEGNLIITDKNKSETLFPNASNLTLEKIGTNQIQLFRKNPDGTKTSVGDPVTDIDTNTAYSLVIENGSLVLKDDKGASAGQWAIPDPVIKYTLTSNAEGIVLTGTDSSSNIVKVSSPASVPTLAWNQISKIGEVGGKEFKIAMPSNPNSNTTYSLTQPWEDKHRFRFSGSDGSSTDIWIPDNNTTYSAGTGLNLSGTTFSLASHSHNAADINGVMKLESIGSWQRSENKSFITLPESYTHYLVKIYLDTMGLVYCTAIIQLPDKNYKNFSVLGGAWSDGKIFNIKNVNIAVNASSKRAVITNTTIRVESGEPATVTIDDTNNCYFAEAWAIKG